MNKLQWELLLRPLFAEAFGTFVLVFAGTGAIVSNGLSSNALGQVGIALTFGLVIMVLIYSIGHISGAHLNPAVTLGFAIARHLPVHKVIPYWLAQLAGALVGSLAIRFLIGSTAGGGVTHPTLEPLPALIFEGILTAVLMFVIMAVATDTRAVGQAAAIAVGGTVALEALFAGPLTGASMNPARSLAPALVFGDLNDLWIYLLGPFVGAAIGAVTYYWLRGDSD